MRILVLVVVLAAASAFALPARAEMIGGNPGPAHNYICPHADGQGPLDCFFDAIDHLYTMCRNVKAIEIIEFGYEKSEEGVNGAKSEYCIDKQKSNIARPYAGALREAHISKQAEEGVRNLHQAWLGSLAHLKWNPPESDEEYKARVTKPYDEFRDRIEGIRKIIATVKERVSATAAKAKNVVKGKAPAKTSTAPAADKTPKP
ncbi:MAG TPA: hypothetical protein VMV45_08225 [Casimicrobiaceae bacterium]|nr:hypothetical protein [Casimicrobiaceae bacterium]